MVNIISKKSTNSTKKIFIPILLILILFFSLYLRSSTFWISHWRGDQHMYLGLAMKLEKYGFDQYNIRGIDIVMMPVMKDNSILLLAPHPAKSGTRGKMLNGLLDTGANYYDLPLFQNAPGFPFALMLSHKVFTIKNQLYATAHSDDNRKLANIKLGMIRRAQFFAVIVPLLFCLLTIIAIFALASYLFSSRIGLYAAFIYSINPINLITSQKVWADDMITFFITLTVLIFITAIRKKIPLIALFAGLTCGIATMAKQSGILMVPAIWFILILLNRKNIRDIKSLLIVSLNGYFLLFSLGFLISTAFWFYKVYQVYGNPLFMVDTGNVVSTDKTGWFNKLASRPHPLVLFPIGIPYLSPILALAYLSIKNFVENIKKVNLENILNNGFIILWCWVLNFFILFIMLALIKEHRYMLPIYPALAILSAYYLDRIRKFVGNKISTLVGETLAIALLILTAFWSIPMGQNIILNGDALLLKPF